MESSSVRRLAGAGSGRRAPLSGLILVLQRRMRARRATSKLLDIALRLAIAILCATAIHTIWQGASGEYTSNPVSALQDWLIAWLGGMGCAFLPLAAIMGASAVPTAAEEADVQAALLARLTGFDICAGRLLAVLWPEMAITSLSCLVWLAIAWQYPGTEGGVQGILIAHLTLAACVFMYAAVGLFFSIRGRPGRQWGRGAGVALFCMANGLGGIFALNPEIPRLADPTPWIERSLLINPAVAITTALNVDILRVQWIYDRTTAPEYPFRYPSPLLSDGLFLAVGSTAMMFSALRLRRAYQ